LIGAPLAMNAIAGPEPTRMSIEPAAAACCIRASPVKAIDSTSRPFLAKMPVRMPISIGVNENASATALPTRSFSAACAGMTSNTAAARPMNARENAGMTASLVVVIISWARTTR